jgi:hypothetical protein
MVTVSVPSRARELAATPPTLSPGPPGKRLRPWATEPAAHAPGGQPSGLRLISGVRWPGWRRSVNGGCRHGRAGRACLSKASTISSRCSAGAHRSGRQSRMRRACGELCCAALKRHLDRAELDAEVLEPGTRDHTTEISPWASLHGPAR